MSTATVLNVAGRKIVLGLEWQLYESMRNAKEAVRKRRNILITRRIVGGECVQGVCDKKGVPSHAIAGAMIISYAAETAIVYQPIGGDRAWVCAVREGAPLHGFDAVLPEAEARNILTEAMSYIQVSDIYGDINGAKGSLQKLVEKLDKKSEKRCQLVPANGIGEKIIVGGLGLGLAGAAAVVGIQYLKKSNLEQEGIHVSMTQMQTEEAIRQMRLEHQRQHENAIAKAKMTLWHAVPANRQFAAWSSVIAGLPVSVSGWRPIEIDCDASQCKVKWQREYLAAASAAQQLPGEKGPVSKDHAYTNFKLGQIDKHEWEHGGDTRSLIDDIGSRLAGGITLLATPASQPVVIAPPAGSEGLKPVTIANDGDWQAGASNYLMVKALMEKMVGPGIWLKSMKAGNWKAGAPNSIEVRGGYRGGSPI